MENRTEELERELKETRDQLASAREQLRLQSRRARQLVAACSSKVEEKEREMQALRTLKDGQLQAIVRKLLHFESLLRKEQQRIVDLVREKDQVIQKQGAELELLRQSNRKLRAGQDHDEVAASKMAKLDESDKENQATAKPVQETPLVTKMVRRFEPPAGKKPEVPKKPARLLANSHATTQTTPPQTTTPPGRGVVRTDSVNDHGYFTLEKRKPVRMSVSPTSAELNTVNNNNSNSKSPSPRDPRQMELASDDSDLRNNFEEFHLMDSLEEEEQTPPLPEQLAFTANETTIVTMATPPRTPDRSSGDGAEWAGQQTPPHASFADCTSLSVSAGSVHILPQIGDATPTSGVQFDRFLDVSGLTQKSILTPSRLISNHKNMLKPKDVKLRHLVNKAHNNPLSLNCRSSETLLSDTARLHHHANSQVRYYVEPFL